MDLKKVIFFAAGLLIVAAFFYPPSSWAVSFEKDIQPIFTKSCVKCHGNRHPKAGIDLSVGHAYQSIVNQPSSEVPDMMRIKPGKPAQSYLWLKLQHTASRGTGMPRWLFFSRHLPQKQLSLIKIWIESGAKK